jgi:hypothetical protein
MMQGNNEFNFDGQTENAFYLVRYTDAFDINASVYEHINQHFIKKQT